MHTKMLVLTLGIAGCLAWLQPARAQEAPAGVPQKVKAIEAPAGQQSLMPLRLAQVSHEKPSITVDVADYHPGAAYLVLTRNQAQLQKVELPPEKSGSLSFEVPVPTNESSVLEAKAYSREDHVLSQSEPLVIHPGSFKPGELVTGLTQNRVVNGRLSNLLVSPLANVLPRARDGSAPEIRPEVTLRVLLDDRVVHTQVINAKDMLILPALPIPKGRHQIQLTAENAWGSYASEKYKVFNLGVDVPSDSFIVADKYNFTLYYIKDGSLARIYPIATGRPRTPTPTGYFKIGRKEWMNPGSTSWGVLRMLLYRPEVYQKHWSGYAIHGTNQPSSIGTEASHGCLRMFNPDVLTLSKMVPEGTIVLIKEKLDVYIEEM